MLKKAIILLTVVSSAAAAQSTSATAQARILWRDNMTNVNAAAEDLSEALYSYRATPEVRSFAELFGHIAGSQKMFCAMALGETPPAEDAVEKAAKTKAELVAALKDSDKFCERAYAQTDAATAGMIDVFGQKRTKLFALMMNAAHDGEHYGNIVTYMRLNKIVPPSSRPRPAR